MLMNTLYLSAALVACVFAYVMHLELRKGAAAKAVKAEAEALLARGVAAFPAYEGLPAVIGTTLCLVPDAQTRMALLVTDGHAKEIRFERITSAEIQTNGQSHTVSRRSGALGRSVVGGVLGGGAGAIVGALTARTRSDEAWEVETIDLAVTTTEPEFPILRWNFFTADGLQPPLRDFEMPRHLAPAQQALAVLTPVFETDWSETAELVAI